MTVTHTRSSRARNVLSGAAATLVLLALIVGLPAALVAFSGAPDLPRFSSIDELVNTLTSPDDGTLFLSVLPWVGWIAWAIFAASTIVELTASITRHPAPRITGLGPAQRVSRPLVRAAALLFLAAPLVQTNTAMAATATVTPTPTQQAHTAASVHPATMHPGTPATAQATPTHTKTRTAATHTVRPGDTLWRLAERYLGDGAQFPRIAKLNYGVAQATGGELTRGRPLRPGWVLTLPDDAIGAPEAPQAAPTMRQHTVRPGETLTSIATDELGDPTKAAAIARASTAIVQPDGDRLTDPDLIRPGWTLKLPGTVAKTAKPAAPAAETKQPAASANTAPESERSAPAPAAPPTGPAPARTEAPANTAPAEAPAAAPVAAPADTTTDTTAVDDVDADSERAVRTVGGVGSLLAAGLLTLIGTKRARRRSKLRAGQRLRLPEGPLASAELEQRVIEDPDARERIDLALRTLSALLNHDGLLLPELRLARYDATRRDLELHLAAPADLPEPFLGTADSMIWVLDADAELLTPAEAAEVPSPWPSLVTIGHDLDDRHLLIDLEQAVALAITNAAPDTATAIVAGLATELATSRWADDLVVTVVGCCPELPDAIGNRRIRHVDNIEALLRGLERRVDDVHEILDEAGTADLTHARSERVATEAWTPEIVLLDRPVPTDVIARLDTVLNALPRVGIAAVTTADDTLGDWALRLDDDGLATLEPFGLTVRPQLLSASTYADTVQILQQADDGATEPGPDWASAHPTVEPQLRDIPGPNTTTITTLDRPGDGPVDPTDRSPVDADELLEDQVDGEHDEELLDDQPDESTAPSLSDAIARLMGTAPPPAPLATPPAAAQPTPEPTAAQVIDLTDTTTDEVLVDDVAVDEAGADIHQLRPNAPMILLLGAPEITGVADSGRAGPQIVEMAAYIKLNPDASRAALSEAIWPGQRVADTTVDTRVSNVRTLFGTDPVTGKPYLSRRQVHFEPDVRSDWDIVQELVADGITVTSTNDLKKALSWVRDQPYAGVLPTRYAHAEVPKQRMISAIVDIADELACRYLRAGDSRAAATAAVTGLKADPGNERLWRARLKAEWQAGNPDGLKTAAARLTALADELGGDLEPETVELLRELLEGQARAQ